MEENQHEGPTIIMRVMGGLGNQLFQFASGWAAARKLRGTLYLDPRWYRSQPNRRFELNRMGLSGFTAPDSVLALCPAVDDGPVRRAKRLVGRWLRPRGWPRVVREEEDQTLVNLDADAREILYLIGYWQRPEFFLPELDAIKRELRLPLLETKGLEEIRKQIESSNAVSVHVRRGDFVSDPKIADTHGALDDDFFKEAISRMQQMLPDSTFFFFSDDPVWVTEHLEEPGMINVSSRGARADEELALMTRCRAHIVSNSSFGWWGAILGNGLDGVVIAPRSWYRNSLTDPALSPWLRL